MSKEIENNKNIIQRIQAVTNEIVNIDKNLEVGYGNNKYKAVSDADVIAVVRKAEEKHGVLSVPLKQEILESKEINVTRSNGKAALDYVDTIKMILRIYNVDDPKEYIDIESHAKGIDTNDKGLGKASTYARKYALLNAYKIITGEEPDATKSLESEKADMEEMEKQLIEYTEKNQDLKNNIISHFKVNSISELNEKQMESTYKKVVLGVR